MRLILASTALFLVVGCATFQREDSVKVGMNYDMAQARILNAGGVRSPLLMKGIRKNWVSPSFMFDGTRLSVSYDSTTHRVVELRVWPEDRDPNSTVMPNRMKSINLKALAPNKTPEHISEGRGRPSENAQR